MWRSRSPTASFEANVAVGGGFDVDVDPVAAAWRGQRGPLDRRGAPGPWRRRSGSTTPGSRAARARSPSGAPDHRHLEPRLIGRRSLASGSRRRRGPSSARRAAIWGWRCCELARSTDNDARHNGPGSRRLVPDTRRALTASSQTAPGVPDLDPCRGGHGDGPGRGSHSRSEDESVSRGKSAAARRPAAHPSNSPPARPTRLPSSEPAVRPARKPSS
jgi:hypothetical protein